MEKKNENFQIPKSINKQEKAISADTIDIDYKVDITSDELIPQEDFFRSLVISESKKNEKINKKEIPEIKITTEESLFV